MLKQEKGITLIALVVTIIILIILAAITIMAISGDHSIVSEAVRTKTLNAYNQIQEQEKLSYSSVTSKIMFEIAKDSTFDARKKANTAMLIKMLENDLDAKVDKSFTFAVEIGTAVKDSTGTALKDGTDDLTEKTIYIKYSNSVIDQGLIQPAATDDSTTADVDESADPMPRYDVDVYTTIKLNAQGAAFKYDVEAPTGLTFGTADATITALNA